MGIHAIQTGSVAIRPNQRQGKGIGLTRLVNTLLDRRWTEPLPIYAWVIEHPEGVILVDRSYDSGTAALCKGNLVEKIKNDQMSMHSTKTFAIQERSLKCEK